ncbi:MAG: formate dehydrogenase [Hyphomicrobiales bacterium]|nr:MAG: formate dehydrogenase [Hyphomicrobiales bacterium]
MTEKNKPHDMSRRDFFRQSGMAVGAAGGAAVALATGAEAAEPETRGKNSVGYRETDHIRTYYELAKF